MKRGILIMKTFISVVVATIGAAGCTTMAMESERYYANRVATDKAQKQAIVDAVSKFMGGKSITLADDVFINEHSMIVERQSAVDSRGLIIDGRHNNPARSFTLLKLADMCLIRDDTSQVELELPTVACVAQSKAK